jgi:hypothetical protein
MGFVVGPKLERTTFTKKTKVLPEWPTIRDRMWNNGILYQLTCGKKNKGAPMVSRFLLHDPSDMGIGQWQKKVRLLGGDVGVEPPLPGGVLHPGKPAVQRRSTPTFWPFLQEISQGAQNLCAFGQKAAVKIHHAKKTL